MITSYDRTYARSEDTVNTALADGYRVLYHWQRFVPEWLERMLTTNSIYCSSPGSFNDPWDCRPYFNSDLLADPAELEQHVAWAVDLCRRKTQMRAADIERMRQELVADPMRAAELISTISAAMAPEIDRRYRVYCLGPDVGNLLMWSHYAESHSGICLEFSLRNVVMCSALRCEYVPAFPIMRLHDKSEASDLRILLAKADVWSYEKEYRLVAQERSEAIPGADTLLTDGGFLQYPQGALTAIIVGCGGNVGVVQELVQRIAPGIPVKRATKVPNRYELKLEG